MAYYRRAKHAVDAFRGFTSKNRAQPMSQFGDYSTTKSSTPVSNKANLPGFSSPYSVIPHKPAGIATVPHLGPFLARNYQVGRHNIQLFKPLGPRWWLSRLWEALLGLLVLYGALYYWISKTVPYTKRTQLVILSPKVERILGGIEFDRVKDAHKEKILPATHPDSVRVTMILKRIIDALLMRELRRSDEMPHLSDLNWEVLVVDVPNKSAANFPGGKIVVYSGLLKECRSDLELVTVIAHELGHMVARHWAENLSNWFILPELVIYDEILSRTKPDHLPFSSRIEFEADHISLLLLASAGYDPREVPSVYGKFNKMRAKMLAQANIMEEALGIYRHVSSEPTIP